MISQGETMERVKVKSVKLIAKLKENFERHTKELSDAKKAYVNKAKDLLNERLKKFEAGDVSDMQVYLAAPQDHTDDYVRAIDMLEMGEDTEVTITATQFAAFVQDKWNWKAGFEATRSTYGGG